MTHANRFTATMLILMLFLADMFYADMKQKEQEIANSCFQYIDNDLLLAYETYKVDDNGIFKCIDIDKETLKSYYKLQGGFTPFGKMLLQGNFLCENEGSE